MGVTRRIDHARQHNAPPAMRRGRVAFCGGNGQGVHARRLHQVRLWRVLGRVGVVLATLGGATARLRGVLGAKNNEHKRSRFTHWHNWYIFRGKGKTMPAV